MDIFLVIINIPSDNKASIKCPLCMHFNPDFFHYLLSCSYFNRLRRKFKVKSVVNTLFFRNVMNNEKALFNVATFVKEILMSLKEIIWISWSQHSACKVRIWEYWYSLIDTCGLCWWGAGISGGLCNCIPQYSVGCRCLSVLGMPASGSKVLMYHVYIINIYSCSSIIVWGRTLICMCMVTLLSMRFCVFICVYMYSCMYLLNCIFIDCLYYWSLLTMYYCFLWICSENFGIKQLELELEHSDWPITYHLHTAHL